MEEILKQILTEMQELKANQAQMVHKQAQMEQNQAKMEQKIDSLGDRMDAHEKRNRNEFKQLNKKLDGITEVIAKSMEDITEIKGKIEKQDYELKVLKGAK